MFESEDESEDDNWMEEWNRGMRQIEEEIDAGVFEIKQKTRKPPARQEVPTFETVRVISPIPNQFSRPKRVTNKTSFYMHETPTSVSSKTGKLKRKVGRPKKTISKPV